MARRKKVEDDWGDEPAEVVIVDAAKERARSIRAAVAMKIHGAPYEEIARVLEYTSPAAARAVVEQGLAESADTKDTASLRRITSARLESLFRMAWDQAQPLRPALDEFGDEIPGVFERNPEQAPYMRLAMDLTARHAKLHGLDAPTQVQLSPAAAEFEETVRNLVVLANRDKPDEADIFGEDDIVDAVVLGPEDEPDA